MAYRYTVNQDSVKNIDYMTTNKNVIIGDETNPEDYQSTITTGNTFIGYNAGRDFNGITGATNNIVIGYDAGYDIGPSKYNQLVIGNSSNTLIRGDINRKEVYLQQWNRRPEFTNMKEGEICFYYLASNNKLNVVMKMGGIIYYADASTTFVS